VTLLDVRARHQPLVYTSRDRLSADLDGNGIRCSPTCWLGLSSDMQPAAHRHARSNSTVRNCT